MHHSSLQIIRDEHTSLLAILTSMRALVARGPGDNPQQFFDVLRAMLFYIDEFPERLHHTKESELLFPRILRAAPSLADTVAQLNQEHQDGERAVRELQHLLLAWELLGDSRMAAFVDEARRYLDFSEDHIRVEEDLILSQAQQLLSDDDWRELDAAFAQNTDPLNGKYPSDPVYYRLYTRIVMKAPAPIGLAGR